jgi:hypothetical protein
VSLLPDELIEAYESASDREAAWVPLADWVHEQRPAVLGARPPQLEQANCELELVSRIPRRAFVNWVDDRPASQFALESLLRHEACALVDELRLGSVWPGSPVMLFGTVGPAAQARRPPASLLPALLNAALASAPPLLRRLEVWIPKNPPWRVDDDCRSQLEPLLRQRPRLAEHLVIRAPRKGLVEFVRRAAANRWRVITLAAPFSSDDLSHVELTAAQYPDVTFQLVDASRRERLAPNLAFVADPDTCVLEVTVAGTTTKGSTAPGRMLEAPLHQALLILGVDFDTDLGRNALRPRAIVGRGELKANARLVLEPFFLRDGTVEIVWAPAQQPQVSGRVRRIVSSSP